MAAGIGFVNKSVSKQYAITVDDSIDYEITFWFKVPTRDPTFEVSAKCFDCALQTEIPSIDVRSGAFNSVFLPGNVQMCSLENRWNFFHCILYGKNQLVENSLQPPTSHAVGTNLIMGAGTHKVFINVTCVRNCMLLWDFKFKPAGTPYSTGFLNSSGLVEIWRKNNKRDLTEAQIETITNRYLADKNISRSVISL